MDDYRPRLERKGREVDRDTDIENRYQIENRQQWWQPTGKTNEVRREKQI